MEGRLNTMHHLTIHSQLVLPGLLPKATPSGSARPSDRILDHQSQNIDKQITRRDASDLSNRVVWRAHFNDIGAHQPDALQAFNEALDFPGGPAAALGRAGRRGDAGIQHVDINAEVDGGVSDHTPYSLDNTSDADIVDLVGLDESEADVVTVNDIVVRAEQLRAQPAVDGRPLGDAALARRVPEERAVGDGGLLRDDAGVPRVGVPGVEVGVQVDDGDWAIDLLQAAQDGEHDAVVASQAEDAGLRPRGARRWCGVVEQDLAVSLLHLDECVLSVERRDWDVSTVDDAEVPCRERVDVPNRIEAAAFLLTRAGGPDASWSEASPRSIGSRGVIWKSYDCDVERVGMCRRETSLPWKMRECHGLREW